MATKAERNGGPAAASARSVLTAGLDLACPSAPAGRVPQSLDPEGFDALVAAACDPSDVDLLFLKKLFAAVGPTRAADHVRRRGADAPSRRFWFLYEWSTGTRLDLPSAEHADSVPVLDPEEWHTCDPVASVRHGVVDNLPGVPDFCWTVRRSATEDVDRDTIRDGVRTRMEDYPRPSRLASSLLLKESKSSFEIESEFPGEARLREWADITGSAGGTELSEDYIVRIQRRLMASRRFFSTGLRRTSVFLGDRSSDGVKPTWIGARHEDVPLLVSGLLAAHARMSSTSDFDPVAHAAALSFGFLYIHPLEDGNGRLSRILLHHVFNERGLAPPGMPIPISKAILRRSTRSDDEFVRTLQTFDKARMPFIRWRANAKLNVDVLNDTSDLYRYADVSEQARFLSRCVLDAVYRDIPEEIASVRRLDAAAVDAEDKISRCVEEFPGIERRRIELLVRIALASGSPLSRTKRKLFPDLSDYEISTMEAVALGSADPDPGFAGP